MGSVAPSAVVPGPSALSLCGDPSAALFEDDAIETLGTVDTSHTLLGALCGRVDDAEYNARVIAATRALHTPAHVVALFYLGTVLSIFAVEEPAALTAISLASCVLGALLLLYIAASLCWDMLRRIVPTFEFAFLFAVNASNGAMWTLIFGDARSAVMLVTGACYVMSLCADANIYTRHLLTRVLAVSSTALPVALALVVFQCVPRTRNPPLDVQGVAISAVDLEVSGSLVIGFFTMKRAQRAQRLVFSHAPIAEIQCDMYLPLCHLVPQAQRHRSRLLSRAVLASLGPHSACQPLLLIDERAAHGINVTKTLLAGGTAVGATHSLAVRVSGAIAAVAFAVAPFVQPSDLLPMEPMAFFVAAVTWLASLCFALCYVAQLQPVLARRVTLEIDAWFVSFHMSLVALCIADAVGWDLTRLLWPCTAWIWCHWVLFLDAVTPQARHRLGFSRQLALVITTLLFTYPVVLSYWVYLSPVRPLLQNRVLLELSLGKGRQRLRVDVLGFLASKLFTLWVWTGRFLWRELVRPADAYRVLKRHAVYRVPTMR